MAKPSILYRVAAALLLLFAVGHTLGFRDRDPSWGADALVALMKSVHFSVQGFDRTYWDLFNAAGFCVGIFYLFAAVLAWQLARLTPEALAGLRAIQWALASCFAAITIVSCRYLFTLPLAFSALITLCLIGAAVLSGRSALRDSR